MGAARKWMEIVSVVGLAASLWGCGAKTAEKGASPPPPSVIHEAKGNAQTANASDDLSDVFFISPATLPAGAKFPDDPKAPPRDPAHQVGFITGRANTLLKTADGGATWRRLLPQKADGPDLDRVLFLSPTEGYVVNKDLLLHTADCGETWMQASNLPGQFYYFGPSSATAGAYFQMQPPTCSTKVWKTTDGGKTWAALKQGLPRNDFEDVFFLDDLHGWVCANHGRLALTEDGGDTWRAQDLAEGAHLVQLQFVTPQKGWIRIAFDGICVTSDGGKTWEKPHTGADAYREAVDMQFLDERVGFLLVRLDTEKSAVLRTLDGGATWQRIGLHHASLSAMSFVDPNHGWVVGNKGCIFRYDLGPLPLPK